MYICMYVCMYSNLIASIYIPECIKKNQVSHHTYTIITYYIYLYHKQLTYLIHVFNVCVLYLRAKCHNEVISLSSTRGSNTGRTRNAIVITELPYMTNKVTYSTVYIIRTMRIHTCIYIHTYIHTGRAS